MRLPELNWASTAIIGMFCIVPSWVAIGFFEKNYSMRPEVFMIWYFFGVLIGSTCLLASRGISIMPAFSPWMQVVAIGLTFGVVANMMLFAATAAAPNPAFTSAIAGTASLVIFCLSFALFRVFPKFFHAVKFEGYDLLGIVVIIAGVFLLARSR